MATPIVLSDNATPVSETARGAPVTVALNGFGVPVTFGDKGAPVSLPPFPDGFSRWQQLPGDDLDVTIDGTEATLVRGTGGIEAIFYAVFSVVPGATYDIAGTVGTSAMSVRVGTSIGNGSMFAENVSTGVLSDTFVATSSPAFISLWPVSESATSTIDDLTITEQ